MEHPNDAQLDSRIRSSLHEWLDSQPLAPPGATVQQALDRASARRRGRDLGGAVAVLILAGGLGVGVCLQVTGTAPWLTPQPDASAPATSTVNQDDETVAAGDETSLIQADSAHGPVPMTIPELKAEPVISGTITSAEHLDATGPADERLIPIALTMQVEERLTPSAESIPSEVTLLVQWQVEDGPRIVDEGMRWLEVGDQVLITVSPVARVGGDGSQSVLGPWPVAHLPNRGRLPRRFGSGGTPGGRRATTGRG